MKLYFEEHFENELARTYIGESRVESIIDALMFKDMEDRNIRRGYLRMYYQENDEICIDYGSHTSFYIITPNEDRDTEVVDEENNDTV